MEVIGSGNASGTLAVPLSSAFPADSAIPVCPDTRGCHKKYGMTSKSAGPEPEILAV